jgi:hypothetical protein
MAESCSCGGKGWQCGPLQGKAQQLLLSVENSTDAVYQLPEDLDPNTWILNTHFGFLERRYGGWRAGVARNDSIGLTRENTAVYFNNKGFHSVAAYLSAANNARLRRAVGGAQEERTKR